MSPDPPPPYGGPDTGCLQRLRRRGTRRPNAAPGTAADPASHPPQLTRRDSAATLTATTMSSNGRAHHPQSKDQRVPVPHVLTEGRLSPAPEVAGLRKGVVLMGMKGSGKSTLGRALAEVRSLAFIDLDTLTEEEFDPGRSLSCREIARTHGERLFRELEAKAVRRLARMIAESPGEGVALVAALGGGTVESAAAMDELAEGALLVYLEEEPALLYERATAAGIPSYLDPANPRESFFAVCARRAPLFEERAHLVVHLMGAEVEQAFTELVRVLTEAGYAR